jgi:hypothetical protein
MLDKEDIIIVHSKTKMIYHFVTIENSKLSDYTKVLPKSIFESEEYKNSNTKIKIFTDSTIPPDDKLSMDKSPHTRPYTIVDFSSHPKIDPKSTKLLLSHLIFNKSSNLRQKMSDNDLFLKFFKEYKNTIFAYKTIEDKIKNKRFNIEIDKPSNPIFSYNSTIFSGSMKKIVSPYEGPESFNDNYILAFIIEYLRIFKLKNHKITNIYDYIKDIKHIKQIALHFHYILPEYTYFPIFSENNFQDFEKYKFIFLVISCLLKNKIKLNYFLPLQELFREFSNTSTCIIINQLLTYLHDFIYEYVLFANILILESQNKSKQFVYKRQKDSPKIEVEIRQTSSSNKKINDLFTLNDDSEISAIKTERNEAIIELYNYTFTNKEIEPHLNLYLEALSIST